MLVVTHLAQVAAQAARHVSIVKQSSNQRTIAKAELLDGEARVLEIARMLAGDSASQTALQHARELLAQEPITTDQLRLV